MTTLHPDLAQHRQHLAVLITLAALTVAAAFLSRSVVNDDPYITYRYARNLTNGVGLVYNAGEPVLSTTAPLYAVLLAALALLGVEPPAASLVVGAIAALTAAILLYRLGARSGHSTPAAVAAGLLAASPLVWMATGMESSLYLALALGAFNAGAERHWRTAGLLSALAALVRGDGLLVVGLVVLAEWAARRRIPWRSGLIAVALIVPAALAALAAYGSPFPATLRAKVLQAELGITGFYPGARFLDGIVRLVAAYFEQSWVYALALPLIVVGLTQLRHPRQEQATPDRTGRPPTVPVEGGWRVAGQRWAWPVIAWGALQMLGYAVLGVAPYRWYYIPILPAVYVLIGLAVDAIARRAPSKQTALAVGLTCIFLAPQVRSIWEIYRSTDPNVSRSELAGIDALPETSGPLYRQIGDWLHTSTPPEASVGVMEVGVIGYYAERRMVDYLGLLQPEVAAALGRRDIYWSIPHTLPDYLVLTSVNPLYNYDLLADAWFKAAYTPAAQFEDARFWGSPITLYRRRIPATPIVSHPLDQTVGPLRLTGYAAQADPLRPETPIRIRLDWASSNATVAPDASEARVSIGLIGPQGRVVAADDLTYDTSTWPLAGGSVYHTLVTGRDIPPGIYRAHVKVETETGSGQTTIGAWKSPLAQVGLPTNLIERAARFGGSIDLLGYTLAPDRLIAGGEASLTLYWRLGQPVDIDYTVFIHVENDDGQLVLSADGPPRQGDYPTSIWSPGEIVDDSHTIRLPVDLPAGDYRVTVGLYRLDSGERLPANGSDQVTLATLTLQQQ